MYTTPKMTHVFRPGGSISTLSNETMPLLSCTLIYPVIPSNSKKGQIKIEISARMCNKSNQGKCYVVRKISRRKKCCCP